MKIKVKSSSRAYKVPVEVIEHDCYETEDYSIEQYEYYQPTPQQIDAGTDHDEVGYVAVCNICGADMPDIDADPEEPDYDD